MEALLPSILWFALKSGLFIVAFSIEHLISGRTTSSADEVGKEIL